jgi:hypothetical protein
MTLLIKRDDLKFNPLEDVVMEDIAPPTWNGPHAGKRIAEAFATLIQLPTTGLRSASGYWPAYSYEWEDLLAQQEQAEEEKTRERHQQNRSRVSPDIQQVSRMERALYWPVRYLWDAPTLTRAVNAVSFARAIDRDIGWVAKRHGGNAEVWQQRHWKGCEFIARGLIADKVAVF